MLTEAMKSEDYWFQLLFSRKGMKNLDRMLESRDLTLPTKICIVKAIIFPLVTDSCESWTVKKEEHQRIYTFELCCWRWLLKVPWTARRSNQVNLRGDQPWILIGRTDAKAEAPVFWSWCQQTSHWENPWCWERLRAKGEEAFPRCVWVCTGVLSRFPG